MTRKGHPRDGEQGLGLETARETAHAWYARTGHCAGCGCPGTYCQCTTPCLCADLHRVGSGRRRGALKQFADSLRQTTDAEMCDGQEELF